METKQPQRSTIRLALQIAGLAVALVVVYLLRDQLRAIVGPVLIAVTIAYLFNPLATTLEKRCRSRTIAVLLIFIVFFGVVAGSLAKILPSLQDEANSLIGRVPVLIKRGQGLLADLHKSAARLHLPSSVPAALEKGLRAVEERLLSFLTQIPQITINFAKGLFTTFLVVILSFYLLRDYQAISDSLYFLIPRQRRAQVQKILREVDCSLGKYIRGQFLLALIVGVMTYLSLLALGVDYSLLWGIIAGITNTIPYFGPFIGAAPAVFIALLTAPILAVKTVLVFFIIQQLESNLISPAVVGKSVGLHPLVVLLALLVGGEFFGVWGLILAVPAVAVGRIVLRNLSLPSLK